ncbi:MAG: hypothetical protein M1840_001419, partial [Geoglossum simile]
RANSESISQPPPSSQCAKKTRIVTSLSANPRRRQIAVNDIDDEEQSTEDEDTVSSTIDDDAIDATQSKGQAEGMEEVEEVEEDDLVEEDAMRYLSVWKATVNTKETLCSKSGIYTESDLLIYAIRFWQREVLEKAKPRQLEIVKLEAIASYKRCRTLDECPFELQNQQDFLGALEVLKMWYTQHKRVSLRITLFLKEAIPEPRTQAESTPRYTSSRRTTTQQQLAELPNILQGEAAAGNLMPQVADYWICSNNHYPVSGEIFRQWSREIADGLSTVEQPSQQIIVLLVNWRERERKKSTQAQQAPKPAEDISSTTNQLLQTLIAAQTQHLAQNLYGGLHNLSTSSSNPPPYTPLAPSSPVHSNSDPSEILTQFFD